MHTLFCAFLIGCQSCVAATGYAFFGAWLCCALFYFLGDKMKLLEWVVKFFCIMLAGVLISLKPAKSKENFNGKKFMVFS